MLENIKKVIRNSATLALQYLSGREWRYDQLPPEAIRVKDLAFRLPFVRDALVKFSVDEYDRNPYYKHVIDTLGNHTIGPVIGIIANSQDVDEQQNNKVEDNYLEWDKMNGVSKAYREIRKEAAKTGIGIGLPYKNEQSTNEVKTSYKTYGLDSLMTPPDANLQDRIYHGIEYDEEWNIRKFHLRDDDRYFLGDVRTNIYTKEYTVEECIYWSKSVKHGVVWPIPECVSAFTFYPFIRRYIQAVLEGEEMIASHPITVELDPQVYSGYASQLKNEMPSGTFTYEPRTIKTLKPGMSLQGIPQNRQARDVDKTLETFGAVCGLAVNMPRNLSNANSNNANMSASQVDLQPWSNKISIDRTEMEPMLHRSFQDYWAVAVRRVHDNEMRRAHLLNFPHIYVYHDLFQHPDPNKRASARATDLVSGATTLNRVYTNMGLNFRREMQKEADSLGMSVEDLINSIIASRSSNALAALQLNTQEINTQDA